MRKGFYVPMMTFCLLLCGCGAEEKTDIRLPYQEMTGCSMEAIVICDQEGTEWEAVLQCDYVPEEESTVEVVSPESIAGVRAVFCDTDWRLEYEDAVLNIGNRSKEKLSPALCLPYLMDALRNGWLLEENEENWGETPCVRIVLDQSGAQEKILFTIWIRQDTGTPLRGEIAVEEEIILSAEFTSFTFYDTIEQQGA